MGYIKKKCKEKCKVCEITFLAVNRKICKKCYTKIYNKEYFQKKYYSDKEFREKRLKYNLEYNKR